MDKRIVNSVLSVFDEYGELIRFEIERFEEALNDEAPHFMDECYLIVLGMKLGLFDALIFDEIVDYQEYIQFLKEFVDLSEEEALFMISCFDHLVQSIGYYFEIPEMNVLLQHAYDHQDVDQLYILGKSYFLGFGVSQDYAQAFDIFLYLYRLCYKQSAYYLGYMYQYGYGIEMDIEKALFYYNEGKDDRCLYQLGMYHLVREQDELAYNYLKQSHDKNAYFYQGLLLSRKKEYALAFDAFYKGSLLFQKDCLYQCGVFFQYGLGTSIELEEAYRCFLYSYYLGHCDGTFELGMMCIENKDIKKGIDYLQQAVLMGSYDACIMLAKFYDIGEYVEKDKTKALDYYRQSIDLISLSK